MITESPDWGKVLSHLLIATIMLVSGILTLRGKLTREKQKADALARGRLTIAEADILFRPSQGRLFCVLEMWIGWLLIAVGAGWSIAAGPSEIWHRVGMSLLILFVGLLFVAGGLQWLLTAKALTYQRWSWLLASRFTTRLGSGEWRPGWLTAVEIVFCRLGGLVAVLVGGAVTFFAVEAVLAAAGLIDHMWLPSVAP